jgi:ketosteroid isomerase-like protein
MATSKSPKELIEALYDAIKAKDFDAIREVCDPEIDWIQNKGFPGGSRCHGVEEVISKVFQGLGREWESFAFQPDEIIGAGECVVVLGRYRGKHRATGNKLDAAAAHVYDVKDRRIARFRQFADTQEIVRAMQPENL